MYLKLSAVTESASSVNTAEPSVSSLPVFSSGFSFDAAKAAALNLSADEIATMEHLAGEMQLDVIRYWEKEMK